VSDANGHDGLPTRQVALTHDGLVAALAMLVGAQVNQTLATRAPSPMVVDAVVGVLAGVLARVPEPTRGEMLASIASGLPRAVDMLDIAARTTSGGVILPR